MLEPWFVTGFCTGEAAFTYSRSGRGINLYFAIKLNNEDSELIGQLQDFFGVGKIYNVKARTPRQYSGFTRPALYYRVGRVAELERVVEHFDRFPLAGKKFKTYKVWREMFLEKRKFRQPDYKKINNLASILSGLTTKNTKLKTLRQINDQDHRYL